MFNYCISNPPYQYTTDNIVNNTAHNIFHFFYDTGSSISSRMTMIFPGGRWMQRSFRGGSQAADLIYPTVSRIEWLSNNDNQTVFPGIGLSDGLSIVHYNANYIGDNIFLNNNIFSRPTKEQILPLTVESTVIIDNIVKEYDSFIIENKLSTKFFGLRTYWVEKNLDKVTLVSDHPEKIDNHVTGWLGDENTGTAKRVRQYWVNLDDVSLGSRQLEVMGSWKVCCSSASIVKNPENSSYRIVDDNSIVGESWTIVGVFGTKEECVNYVEYLNSGIVRKLLAESKGGKTRTWGYFVPDLGDYSDENPDIDWSEPLDDQLEKLFGLTESQENTI